MNNPWHFCIWRFIVCVWSAFDWKAVSFFCRTCDRDVVCSTTSRALRCSHLGQVIHTCVPLSPSSIIWYLP